MKGRDVFLCSPVRTPVGRYGGVLASLRADDLAAAPLKALLARHPRLDQGAIDDVILGAANQSGEDNRNVARMAALLAGLPAEVPGTTVNRLCGSGAQAVLDGARAIAVGEADLIIAGGAESMSRAPYVLGKADRAQGRGQQLEDTTMGWRFVNPRLAEVHGVESMAKTAENVAAEHGVARTDQDAFALRSHQRAVAAQESGRFDREIVATVVPGPRGTTAVVEHDEHPRPDTSLEKLARLRPIVRAGGVVTAGNASGINDGAAAMLLACDGAVKAHGLEPVARVVGGAVAGVAPRVMGLGPVPASRKLCERLGWRVGDVDVVELNEAFAAQSLACLRLLGLPDDAEHVNPNGGAIALGHPLGMSGARLVGTAGLELAIRGGHRAIVALCIGVGQGIAVGLEGA